ncbi:MAG: Ig-like domain repeat protein, partial [Vallitaleaceae bacterium]|nr:Ig-like domain repeat protein [Vallitaleaceae bacterium]
MDMETYVNDYTGLMISNIDKTPPSLVFQANTSQKTKENVEVTLFMSDEKSEPVTLTAWPVEPVVGKYIFTQNGSYEFRAVDALGNEGIYTLHITNIDKSIQPKITYDIPSFTNQNVKAIVSSDEESLTVVNNSGNPEYVFTENGSFTFVVVDEVGNTAEITAVVDWINKEGYDFQIIPSTKERTNQPVELVLNYQDQIQEVQILEGTEISVKEGSPFSYIVNKNGRYRFRVTDHYQNSKEVSIYVGNVDMTAPLLSYELGYQTATGRVTFAENEVVTVVAKEIRILFSQEENYSFTQYDPSLSYDAGSQSFMVYDNGEYVFTAKDLAGNTTSKTIIIEGIDKTPPLLSLQYSTQEITKDSVLVTLESDKEILISNNQGQKTRWFTENGSFTFMASDLAGNKVEITAHVNHIDKKAPVIIQTYSTRQITNETVTVALSATEEFILYENEVMKNVSVGSTYEVSFEENATKFFTVRDLAGNESKIFVEVSNIDKQAPDIQFL